MAPTSDLTLAQALRASLRDALARDERVVLFGADLGVGGVFQVTAGLRQEFGPERVVDMPLAENGVVGVSIGAALAGLRPVAEVQFADFLFAAMHQIVNEAAKMRYRSRGDWTCPLVIRAPYGGGLGAGPDHSQSVEAFFAQVPGLKVVIPATPADGKGLLSAAIRDDDPVIFLEPKRLYRQRPAPVPTGEHVVPLGHAAVRRAGHDASVITYGALVADALEAAETLAAEGIALEVVDLRTLRPLDRATVLASVRKTARAVVFHEAPRFAGFGAEVAALIAEQCFGILRAPVTRLGARSAPIPASPELEAAVLPGPRDLVRAVRDLIA